MVVLQFALGNDKDSFMDVGVELLAHGTELCYFELRKNLVHQFARHLLTFADVLVLLLYLLHILNLLNFLRVAVLKGQLQTVSYVQELLGELGDGKLLAIFDLFKVPLDSVVILSDLVC